jgi:Domain of unknown function (DUF4407)
MSAPVFPHHTASVKARISSVLLWVATVDEPDLKANSDRKLYQAIGFFICFFGIYGCLAYYAFLTRVGLHRIASSTIGILVTVVVALLVTSAVVAFDRTLVAQIDANLDTVKPATSTTHTADETYLHPVGRRKRGVFLGRLLLAIVVSLFATQTIELFVFGSDIEHAREERVTAENRTALQDAEATRQHDAAAFAAEQTKLRNRYNEEYRAEYLGRLGQHGLCAPETACNTRRTQGKALFAEYHKKKREDPALAGSADTQRIAGIQAKQSELEAHPARVLGRDGSILQDVTALYPYLLHHLPPLLYYIAFTLVFFCVDLGALLLKYGFAWKSEYERTQALRQRVRWLHTAEDYRRQAALATSSQDEEEEAFNHAVAERRVHTEASARARDVERRALIDAYAVADTAPEVVRAAALYARSDLVDRLSYTPSGSMSQPASTDSGSRSASQLGVDASRRRPKPSIDSGFLVGVLSAVGGIIAFVYLLGGTYMYAQLRQASLPATALTYIPARTMIRDGIVIAIFAVLILGGLATIVRPVAALIVKEVKAIVGLDSPREVVGLVWSRVSTWLGQFRGRRGTLPKASASARIGGGGAALAVAALAGEFSDIGVVGGLEAFAAVGFGTLILGFVLLGFLGVINPATAQSRSAALFLVTVCATFGAYEAGSKRPFKLPVAELHLTSQKSCREAKFLGESDAGVYLVDGVHQTLEVIPWRVITGFSIRSTQASVSAQSMDARCRGLASG